MRKCKGFTLIEVLIVVAIILSLSVILSIKYIGIVENNNIKIDKINARVISEGIKLAGISGDIDLNNDKSNQSVVDKTFEPYFDINVLPKSKKYTSPSGFTYSIQNQKVIIFANGMQIYPEL